MPAVSQRAASIHTNGPGNPPTKQLGLESVFSQNDFGEDSDEDITISDAEIIVILQQAEDGVPVAQLCREHGMRDASFYKRRARPGGMDASMAAQMKNMEDENRRLKKMYAD